MENITHVSPEGREFLAFSYQTPEPWKTAEIPAEEPNFESPEYFLPLAAAVSPCGNFAFTVGARMAYADGTLLDWLQFLCSSGGIEVGSIEKWTEGDMVGVIFDGLQQADGGVMRSRNVYVEDGGRLFAVSTMTTQPGLPLPEISATFRLANAAGPTVALNS